MRYKIIKLNTMLEKKQLKRGFFSLKITNIIKKNFKYKEFRTWFTCSHNHLAKDPSINCNIELDMRSQLGDNFSL